MKTSLIRTLSAIICLVSAIIPMSAHATAEYKYKPGEYVTISHGTSPNKLYAIAAHGEGEYGFDNFHLYLMNAEAGKKIASLKEVAVILDTAASAYSAEWAPDSSQVSITYRSDRHIAVIVKYRIKDNQAILVRGPVKTN